MAEKEGVHHIEAREPNSSNESIPKDEQIPAAVEQDWTPEEERKLVCVPSPPSIHALANMNKLENRSSVVSYDVLGVWPLVA